MFSAPVFITIGDEYDKKDSVPDRYKGKSMLTSSTKRGFVQDALFEKKVQSLSEGDKYVEPGYFDKRYRMENEKRKLTAEGFRYSNPSHKSTGAGDYFGTFNEKNPHKHEVEFAPPKQGEASAKALAAPRNITTNPGKRGTYGFANLTIGEPIKYISDPYDARKRSEALEEKCGTRAVVAGTAFRAACQKQDYFDQTPHGVPKIYTLDKPLPARKAAPEEKKPELRTPFRPGGSLVPTITKRPAYIEDPYELKEKAAREAKKNEKPVVAWKPLGSSKSLPVRPIKFTPA